VMRTGHWLRAELCVPFGWLGHRKDIWPGKTTRNAGMPNTFWVRVRVRFNVRVSIASG